MDNGPLTVWQLQSSSSIENRLDQTKKKKKARIQQINKKKKEDPATSDIPKENTGFFPNWLVDQIQLHLPLPPVDIGRPFGRPKNSPSWQLSFSREISPKKALGKTQLLALKKRVSELVPVHLLQKYGLGAGMGDGLREKPGVSGG